MAPVLFGDRIDRPALLPRNLPQTFLEPQDAKIWVRAWGVRRDAD